MSLDSGKFTFRDYNFTTPSADLTAKTVQPGNHPHNAFEVYEYPGPYDQSPGGQALTDIRMQAISQQPHRGRGRQQRPRVAPGLALQARTTIRTRQPTATTSSPHAEFSMSIAEGSSGVGDEGETLDTYRVTLRAIPGDVPFAAAA